LQSTIEDKILPLHALDVTVYSWSFSICCSSAVLKCCLACTSLFTYLLAEAQNPLHSFPRNFPVHGEAAIELVADLATRPTSLQQAGDKSL